MSEETKEPVKPTKKIKLNCAMCGKKLAQEEALVHKNLQALTTKLLCTGAKPLSKRFLQRFSALPPQFTHLLRKAGNTASPGFLSRF